jgi:hypothetical protein
MCDTRCACVLQLSGLGDHFTLRAFGRVTQNTILLYCLQCTSSETNLPISEYNDLSL